MRTSLIGRVPRAARLLLPATALFLPGARPLLAQGAAQLVAAGDSAYVRRDAPTALRDYEAALTTDPRDYAALWRAARTEVDVAEFDPSASRRDSLFRAAAEHGRAAVAVRPGDAEGHFALARALGRAALTLGVRDRVRYAAAVREEALACLRLNPAHPGCLHVMGVWNAEVMRLGGFQRMFARSFLGGSVFGTASWRAARQYMVAAVTNDPRRIVHRLDLARVYRDMGETANARTQYQLVIDGPLVDYNDPHYKAQAAAELARL